MIRGRILLFLLGVTVIAVWFAPESREVVTASPRAIAEEEAPRKDIVALAVVPDFAKSPSSFERAADKLLGARPDAPAKRAPSAPSLPQEFVLLGKAQLDGSWKAVVSHVGKTHIAGTGDRIDGRFLIERVDPPTVVVVDLEQAKHRFILSVGDVR